MARKKYLFSAESVSYRLEDDTSPNELLFLGDDFSNPRAYPEDHEMCPPSPSAVGLSAVDSFPEPVSGVPDGVSFDLETGNIAVNPGVLASSAEIESFPLPRHLSAQVVYPQTGIRVLGTFLLPATLGSLASSGGDVWVGANIDANHYMRVGIRESGTNISAYLKLVVGGATIVNSNVPLSSSGGEGKWLHLHGDLYLKNFSGTKPFQELRACISPGADKTVFPDHWSTNAGSSITQTQYEDFLEAMGAGGVHAFGGEPHGADEFSTLIGSIGIF